MNTTQKFGLEIVLAPGEYALARKFAEEQANQSKARQVYANTLAVLAVDRFCQWAEVETDLQAGDCWRPEVRAVLDVSDLVLPGIGKIECLAIEPEQEEVIISHRDFNNRLAFVLVVLHPEGDRAEIIGYLPVLEALETDTIKRKDAQNIEGLLEYLLRLETGMLGIAAELEEIMRLHFGQEEPVQVAVKNKLMNQSLAEIVTKLETLFQIEEGQRSTEGGKLLAGIGRMGFLDRGWRNYQKNLDLEQYSSDQDEDILANLSLVAEDLLAKLAEVWGLA